MNKLSKFGVQELNAVEVKETQGGYVQYILGALIAGAIYDFTDGFIRGAWAGMSE